MLPLKSKKDFYLNCFNFLLKEKYLIFEDFLDEILIELDKDSLNNFFKKKDYISQKKFKRILIQYVIFSYVFARFEIINNKDCRIKKEIDNYIEESCLNFNNFTKLFKSIKNIENRNRLKSVVEKEFKLIDQDDFIFPTVIELDFDIIKTYAILIGYLFGWIQAFFVGGSFLLIQENEYRRINKIKKGDFKMSFYEFSNVELLSYPLDVETIFKKLSGKSEKNIDSLKFFNCIFEINASAGMLLRLFRNKNIIVYIKNLNRNCNLNYIIPDDFIENIEKRKTFETFFEENCEYQKKLLKDDFDKQIEKYCVHPATIHKVLVNINFYDLILLIQDALKNEKMSNEEKIIILSMYFLITSQSSFKMILDIFTDEKFKQNYLNQWKNLKDKLKVFVDYEVLSLKTYYVVNPCKT